MRGILKAVSIRTFVLMLVAAACGETQTAFNSRAYLDNARPIERLLVLADVKSIGFDDGMYRGFEARMTKLLETCGVKSRIAHKDDLDLEESEREHLALIMNEFHPTAALSVRADGGTMVRGHNYSNITSDLLFGFKLVELGSEKTTWLAKAKFSIQGEYLRQEEVGERFATSIVLRLHADGVLSRCPSGTFAALAFEQPDACKAARRLAVSEAVRIKDEVERQAILDSAPTCLSRTAQAMPSASPTWLMVSQSEIIVPRAQDGDRIEPDEATKAELARTGRRASGAARVCLDDRGKIIVARTLRTTGFPAYDAKIIGELRARKFRRFTVEGTPIHVCSDIAASYPPATAPPPHVVNPTPI